MAPGGAASSGGVAAVGGTVGTRWPTVGGGGGGGGGPYAGCPDAGPLLRTAPGIWLPLANMHC